MAAKPDAHYYMTAALVGPMTRAVQWLGGDPNAALAAGGLCIDDLSEPEHRIDGYRVAAVFRNAVAQLGEDLGLRMSALYQPGSFAVLDYLARSSATLGAALERMIRYEAVHLNCMHSRLVLEAPHARVVQTHLLEELDQPALRESSLANLVVIGRNLTGERWSPLEVSFRHPAPQHLAAHERLFGCPVHWCAEENSLRLPLELLDKPVVSANALLAETLETHAMGMLSRLQQGGTVSAQVRTAIAPLLPDGAPKLAVIGRALGVSTRTLQRRLADEGVGVLELVDQVRADLALSYLDDTPWSTEEVALMLGFSDARAFRRAFKRWHGVTPGAYRDSRRSQGSSVDP